MNLLPQSSSLKWGAVSSSKPCVCFASQKMVNLMVTAIITTDLTSTHKSVTPIFCFKKFHEWKHFIFKDVVCWYMER